MVGENFEIYLFETDKNAFKLSTVVGENCEIYLLEKDRNAFKLSTMVGESFEIQLFQMVKNANLSYPPWLEKVLKFTCSKWLKMQI